MKNHTKAFISLVVSAIVFFTIASQSNAVKPSDFGLKEGDLISAIFSDDPDVYIINEQGYKRLFLNPEIFKFYTHLGGFANIKLVTPEIRDSFPTSGFFRNCEDNDQKVFGTSVEGEDSGRLHWINKSGDQAVQEDPDFFKKVFCINRKEFNWYPRGTEFKELKEVPQYHRTEESTQYVICHHPTDDPNTPQTIRVAEEALNAHFEHGDTKGACPTYSLPVLTPSPTVSGSPAPAPYVEICYNCPSPTTSYSSDVCRTFSYGGDDSYTQDNVFLKLLEDKGVKITGSSGQAWSTRLSGPAGNTGEVVGLIPPDRSEADLGISDNENLIVELTNEFAQAVEISLTVTPSATSNNVPATVLITALDQTGRTVAGISPTFIGVTDGKLTPATYVLKSSKSEIKKVIIQAHKYPPGGVWFKSINATNACTTVSTPVLSSTPIPTKEVPISTPVPTASFITIALPNGGEVWQKGTTQFLGWDSSGISKVYIKLRKGNDTYPGPEGKISDVISNFLSEPFKWSVPTTLPDGNDYSVRVIDGNFTGIFDDSDKPFSLVSAQTSTYSPTPTPTPTPTSTSATLACTDTDDGFNYSVRGTGRGSYSGSLSGGWIFGENSNQASSRTDSSLGLESIYYDHCFDSTRSNQLNEAYCKDGKLQSLGYPCPYGCSNGVCKSAPTPTPALTVSPTPSITASPSFSPTPTPTPTLSQAVNCYVKINGVVIKSVYATDRNNCYSQTSFGSANCSTYTSYFTEGTHFLEQYFGATDRVNNEYCTCKSGVCVQGTGSTSFQSEPGGLNNFSRGIAGVSQTALSRDLYFGATGDDVKYLQALLVNEVGYSADLITGYFGRITRDAVKRLQEKYGIKPTYGYFGQITRKTLNALISD